MLKPRFETDPLEDPKGFRDALVRWFSEEGKDYPWRRTQDPYEILVSEVMLQQTQIATVLGKGYYTRFLETFPNVAALAAAGDAALLKAWEGLGYYRRVRMLRDTARAVIEEHEGNFPKEEAELMKLPGVGRYTTGALRAFAFGVPAVLVDGNVARVLARLMDFSEPIDDGSGLKRIWTWAGQLADAKQPRSYHAALMELGQTRCRPGVPDCLSCPLARFCKSREPAALPVKGKKTAITDVEEHALWLRDPEGRILLHQGSGNRRTGLWQLPVRKAGELDSHPILAEHRYGITRYRVTLKVHDAGIARARFKPAEGDCWVEAESIHSLAMAAPFRKVVERLLADS